MREAELPLGVIDEHVHRVAVGHDHACGLLTQQRFRGVAVAVLGSVGGTV